MAGGGRTIYDQIYGDGEEVGPITAEQRAARARALQSTVGVTQAPLTSPPQSATDSKGTGFWDQFKAEAAHNTEKFLNFATGKPQPTDEVPKPTTLPAKLGGFASGIIDPVNMIGYGAAGKTADLLGVPEMAERLVTKLPQTSIWEYLAKRAAKASVEGAAVGAAGQPAAEYLRAQEEGRDYDPAQLPKDIATGAAYGAVLDPAFRAAGVAAHIGTEAFKGAYPMPGGQVARSHWAEGVPHGDAADLDVYDPWSFDRTPDKAQANIGMSEVPLPDLQKAGKLFIKGARDAVSPDQYKFSEPGDMLEVHTPVDPEWLKQKLIEQGVNEETAERLKDRRGAHVDSTGWESPDDNLPRRPHEVYTDIHIQGDPADKTLHIGWLKHSDSFPYSTRRDPGSQSQQPIETPRETALTMRVIQDQLIKHPDIKWLDTYPINAKVMKLLAKHGGQWEASGNMVVPADNIRTGTKVEIDPVMMRSITERGAGASLYFQLHSQMRGTSAEIDPTGRLARQNARYAEARNRVSPVAERMYQNGIPRHQAEIERMTRILSEHYGADIAPRVANMLVEHRADLADDYRQRGQDQRRGTVEHEYFAHERTTHDLEREMRVEGIPQFQQPSSQPSAAREGADAIVNDMSHDRSLRTALYWIREHSEYLGRDYPQDRLDAREAELRSQYERQGVDITSSRMNRRIRREAAHFVEEQLEHEVEQHQDTARAPQPEPEAPPWDDTNGPPPDFDPNDRHPVGVDPTDMMDYDDVAGGESMTDIPRDEDGNLLYSMMGPPLPNLKRAARAARAALQDTLQARGRQRDVIEARKTEPVINVDKLPVSDDVKARLAESAEPFRQLKQDEAVSRGDAKAAADEIRKTLGENYQSLSTEAARRMSGPELRARNDAIIDIDHQLNELGKALDAEPKNMAIQNQMDKLLATRHAITKDLVIGEGAAGRDLVALRYAPDSFEGWMRKARRAAGDNPIPEHVEELIRRLTDMIKSARDPQSKQLPIDQLTTLLEGLEKRPAYQHLIDLFKTVITTPGPIDSANVTANTAQLAADTVSHNVAAFADTVVKLFADAAGINYERKVGAVTGEGAWRGLKAGHMDAKAIMNTGISEHAAGKFGKPVGEHFKMVEDLVGQSQAAIKTDNFIQSYMRLHWRRFGAADAYFRETRFAMSLASEAHLKAVNEGLSGKAAHDRAAELLRDPSANPTMVTRAMDDALKTTYNKDNAFADAIHTFSSKLGPVGKVVTNTTVPFVRTVANVAESMIDYTPVVGLVKEIYAGKGDGRRILMGLGRNVTGGGVFALGYMLAKQGLITGSGDDTTPQKQMQEAQGSGAYMFRSDKDHTWRDYNRILGALSAPLAAGANWYAMEQDAKTGPGHTPADKVRRLLDGSIEQLADQSPGGQLSQLSSHKASDPASYLGNIGQNIAVGALTPAVMANAAKGLDQNERETNTFSDRLKSRIPGLRETLPVKVDATGRSIPRPEGLLPTLVDPSNPHEQNDSPVLTEMGRLGMNMTKPATTGTYLPQEQMERLKAGVTKNVIPERYDRDPSAVQGIAQAAGPQTTQALERLMAQPSYQQMPDELKRRAISGIIDGYRMRATILYEKANPQPVQPPQWP